MTFRTRSACERVLTGLSTGAPGHNSSKVNRCSHYIIVFPLADRRVTSRTHRRWQRWCAKFQTPGWRMPLDHSNSNAELSCELLPSPQIDATPENAQAVAGLVRKVSDIWLALAQDGTAPKPQDAVQQAALEHTDAMLLAYVRRDPDNKVALHLKFRLLFSWVFCFSLLFPCCTRRMLHA